MYTEFFRLTHAPFSIAPDPRYLFMSERHREALAHLLYGIDSGGGVVLLSGDIGTGKTTICRCFLEQVPASCHVAYIFNPKLTVRELLQSVCEEFHIALAPGAHSLKDYIDALNRHLLATHADGRNNVLVIDEAQNLSADVLEQLRLLTNLETNESKLLQIILIGQPELRAMLARPELEQLAQRVIAHYHLTALSEAETASYIQHRLTTAGLNSMSPFPSALTKQIHRLTLGIPRRINLLCDRALLGAYARGMPAIDRALVSQAASELFASQSQSVASKPRRWPSITLGLLAAAMAVGATAWTLHDGTLPKTLGERLFLAAPESPANAAAATSTATASLVLREADDAATIISEHDGSTRLGARADHVPIQELAQRWGVSLDSGEPCAAAEKAGLRCYGSAGGFAELRQIDRPAVIKLHDRANTVFYAVLDELSDSSATLRIGSAIQTVSLMTLTRHFQGDFVTLSRTPPAFGEAVKVGDQGPAVDWIAAQLANLNKTKVPPAGHPFDQQTRQQVRQFQQAHGLFVDGIVGLVTLMQLSRAAGVDEPRLVKRVDSNRED